MANLESITKKIDSGQGSLGGLVNAPTVYEDLKTMMGGAKRSTVLKSVMKSFIDDGKTAESGAKNSYAESAVENGFAPSVSKNRAQPSAKVWLYFAEPLARQIHPGF